MSLWNKIFVVGLLLSNTLLAQITVHVLNPWRSDSCAGHRDSIMLEGIIDTGWGHRGMTAEGGNWFYYAIPSRSVTFTLVTFCGPETWKDWVSYKKGYQFKLDSLLAPFPQGTIELWLVFPDSSQLPKVYDRPPGGKVLYVFNPWPDNSPQMIVGDRTPVKMRPTPGLCGWYTGYYAGPLDSLWNVKFTDFFHTKVYTASGMVTGPGIDVRTVLRTGDTVYILPKPFPYGPPSLTATFPGKTGECGFRKVSGLFRDWKQDDVSFFNNPMGMSGGGNKNMVQTTLVASNNYKPLKTTDAAVNIRNLGHLETWFVTDTFPAGSTRKTNDTCIDIELQKAEDGRWEFDSDVKGGFFPLDSLVNPNNVKYFSSSSPTDPAGRYHNYHFTMEMHLQFIYHKGANLEFDFQGDDDLWIFINNRLAIDLGGLNYIAKDTLWLDRPKTDLGLVDGKTYSMDIFFAERNPYASNFKIKTSMDLHNTDQLYFKDTVKAAGLTQYDIWQRITTVGGGCGQNLLWSEEGLATVTFSIDGPQFTTMQALPQGVSFGGITVDPGKSRITIDSAAITGLIPGEYHITFVSTVDNRRTGYLTFIVAPLPPHHFDIMTDSIALNQNKDAVVDSIVIGMLDSLAGIYAVQRDINQLFLMPAKNPVWTSRDPSVVTVAQAPLDPSRCIITKKAAGTTWVVVSDPAGVIKPDSVRIVTYARPPYPLIISAVMLDGNADLVPDTLRIMLSDTLKSGQQMDSVQIDYRGNHYTVTGTGSILRQKELLVPFASLTGTDGRPSGTVAISMTISGSARDDSRVFTDGVGPALKIADVLENDGTQPDVLILAFSEPVVASLLENKQLLLISAGTSDTVLLNVTRVLNAVSDSSVSVQISSTDHKIFAGDRLRLLPGSKGGAVTDLAAGNKPHDLNRSVVVGFRAGAAPIASSWYVDGNADGVRDTLYVIFKRKVELSEVKTITLHEIIATQHAYYTIAPGTIAKVNDSTFGISLVGTVTRPDRVITGGAMDISVEYVALPKVLRSLPVADSAAPVIVSARFFPGVAAVDGVTTGDSIEVRFSETVTVTSLRPFMFSTGGSGVRYSILVGTGGPATAAETRKFAVIAVEPAGAIENPLAGDTVWLDPAAGVKDGGGVVQTNPQNRRVLLDVTWPKAEWVAGVSRNPFSPSSGTVIKVGKKAPFDVARTSASVAIYDAMGNVVLDEKMTLSNTTFSFVWKGINRNNRLVGTGAYLAIIKVREDGRQIYVKKMKIGVRR